MQSIRDRMEIVTARLSAVIVLRIDIVGQVKKLNGLLILSMSLGFRAVKTSVIT